MTEEKENWLSNIKVGDEVAVNSTMGCYKDIERVERITNTMIKTKQSSYRKKNGHEITSNVWGGKTLIPLTQEIIDGIKLRNKSGELNELIRKTSIISLGIERIEKIIEIIKLAEKDKKLLEFAKQTLPTESPTNASKGN